jgi:hypothetical protein
MPSYNIELRNAERIWETLAVEADDVDALRVEVATFVGELMRDHARTIWQDQSGAWTLPMSAGSSCSYCIYSRPIQQP